MDTEDTLEKCFDQRNSVESNAYNMGEWFLRKYRLYASSTKDYAVIWCYNEEKGIVENDFSDIIAKEVRSIAKQWGKRHLVAEVIHHVKSQAYDRTVVLGGPPEKIVVANGVLNMRTATLEPFHPDEHHIIALPVNYDPEAKCPNRDRFLEEVVPPENDRLALDEYTGYCLINDYRYSNFLLLVGSGRNGKSTYLDVTASFLGRNNVVAHSLQSLAHRQFSTARLYGKLANICADIPGTPIEYTGIIKELTGGDIITADQKFREGIEFVNRAKLWFSANEVPIARDSSDAFHSRVRIIDFPNRFEDGAAGTANKHRLLMSMTTPEELSGILNHAVEGWHRYDAQGMLTGSLSIEEKRLDYEDRSDPIAYFCHRYILQSEDYGAEIEHNAVYSAYCKMCYRKNRKPVSSNWFSQRFKPLVPYADRGRSSDAEERVTVWRGIRFDEQLFQKDQGEIL